MAAGPHANNLHLAPDKITTPIIGADFRFEVPGQSSVGLIGGRRGQWLGGHHGECGARAYNGGLGAEPPSGVQGQSPWSGRRSPPEAESILVIGCPTEPANLAPVRENSMFCYGPLVSELGGQSAWCPQPRH